MRYIKLTLTGKQSEILDRLRSKQKQATFIRLCIADYCQRQGIEWPDDLPTHGGKRK